MNNIKNKSKNILIATAALFLGLVLCLSVLLSVKSVTTAEAMTSSSETQYGGNITQMMQSNNVASNTPFSNLGGYSSSAKMYYINVSGGTLYYFKKTEISFPITVGDDLFEPVGLTVSGQPTTGSFMEGTATYFIFNPSSHVFGSQVIVYWDVCSVDLPEDPVKEGYTFVGWYLDEDLTVPYDGRPITEETTLYAKFEINTYTVTLNTMGGDSLEAVSSEYNTTPVIPTPTRAGYDFIGWYTDETLKTAYTAGPIKSDFTLYAKWILSTVTVTFSTQHGSAEPQTIDYGGTVILPELTETGYEFIGWYTLTGIKVTEETTFTENTTVYGLWQGETVTVIFMVNGELYDMIEVPYGAVLTDVETESNVTVQSVSMADGSLPDTDERGTLLLTGAAFLDVKLPASSIPDTDTVSTFTDYLPYIAIGIALLCVIGVLAVSLRRS